MASATGAAPAPATAGAAGATTPRFVALLFDDVNSAKADLAEARNAAARFLREELGPGDEMAVFAMSGNPNVGFTQDRAALTKAITEISPHPRTGRGLCPAITPYNAYLISQLHDPFALSAVAAVCSSSTPGSAMLGHASPGIVDSEVVNSGSDPLVTEADTAWEMTRSASLDALAAVRRVTDYTAKQPGRRIVVLASSGFLTETMGEEKEEIVKDALQGNVVINSLDAKGLYTVDAGGMSLREE